MSRVLVRDLEPELIEKLKARARRHNRSLQAELKDILEHAAASAVDVRAEVERVRAMFAGRSFSDSAELIREDRDR